MDDTESDSDQMAIVLRDRALAVPGWRQDLHDADNTVDGSEYQVFLLDCSQHAYQLGASRHSFRV